jgi:hypothetical protein
LLRHARLAPVQLQKQAHRLARKVGLSAAPAVYLVPGRLSPLLWSCFGAPRLVLPAALLEQIDDDQRATLILHELAHLRRRDHWVRALEFVTMCLYWWNPVVWFARRELREAEEQCCDAWVVSALPQANRTYATALVETIDFLSAAPATVPLLASGVGPISDLKRRLTMIMRGTTPRTLSWRGVLVVCGLGAFLLPLLPALVQAQDKKEVAEEPRAAAAGDDYLEMVAELEAALAADPNQEELQKLKAQLEQKVQEIRETEAKMRAVREALRQLERGKTSAADSKATIRLLVHANKGGVAEEIILRQADGKWVVVDPKTVKGEKLHTISVTAGSSDRVYRLTTATGKTTTTDPAKARIDELERKLEKVMKLMEQMRQQMQPRPPAINRGVFQQNGPEVPQGFGAAFVPAAPVFPVQPPAPVAPVRQGAPLNQP